MGDRRPSACSLCMPVCLGRCQAAATCTKAAGSNCAPTATCCHDTRLQATKPVLTQGRQVLGHDGEVLLEDSHEQQYISREALYM
jgi:hypothetical protein